MITMNLADFTISGLKEGWENHSPVYFRLTENCPAKNSYPSKEVACVFEEGLKQMRLLKLHNGSRVNCSGVKQNYISKGTEFKYSVLVRDFQIIGDLPGSKASSNNTSASKSDIEADLNSL